MTVRARLVVALVLSLTAAQPSLAQPIGQFRWQLTPFCNVITLNIVQSGGVFQLDGFDDQCGGAAPRAAVVGTAFLNPGGFVGMGLTIVAAPSGTALHVDARLNPNSVSGTWHDSSGNAGTLAFTPGAPSPGSARPAPRAVFPAGLTAGGTTIGNVASPLAVTDAANRGYVDTIVATRASAAELSLIVPLPGAGYGGALPAAQVALFATTIVTPRSGFLKLDLQVAGSVWCVTMGRRSGGSKSTTWP